MEEKRLPQSRKISFFLKIWGRGLLRPALPMKALSPTLPYPSLFVLASLLTPTPCPWQNSAKPYLTCSPRAKAKTSQNKKTPYLPLLTL